MTKTEHRSEVATILAASLLTALCIPDANAGGVPGGVVIGRAGSHVAGNAASHAAGDTVKDGTSQVAKPDPDDAAPIPGKGGTGGEF
jgi:hypothetical protein